MIKWEKTTVSEKGVHWADYRSKDGHWWIAEGYDERARKQESKPFTLFYRENTQKDRWTSVDTFHTIADAKSGAEELEDET